MRFCDAEYSGRSTADQVVSGDRSAFYRGLSERLAKIMEQRRRSDDRRRRMYPNLFYVTGNFPDTVPTSDPAPATKVIKKRPRRSILRDKKSFDFIRACGRHPEPATATGPVSSPTTPFPHLKPILDRLDTLIEDGRLPPSWENTNSLIKTACYFRAVGKSGSITFTANLTPAIEAKAAAQASPANWLLARIRRQLKATLGDREVALRVEAAKASGRLHVHGVVEATGNDLDAVVEALRAAAGRQPRDVVVKPVTDIDGWADYCHKHNGFTRRVTGKHGLMAASLNARRLAKSEWEELRRNISYVITQQINDSMRAKLTQLNSQNTTTKQQ